VRRITATLAIAVALSLPVTAWATPDPEEDGHKVAICHRTASDTNPYVYIEVDEASLSPGHLDNADPGHKPTYWKSDGVWRDVQHVAGDPKDDYLAEGPEDCEDTQVPPTSPPPTTPPPTTPPTSTPPTVPPTHTPTWTPTWTPTGPDKPNVPEKPDTPDLADTGFDAAAAGGVAIGLAALGMGALWYARKLRF
jgi:hypothetical protein